MRNFLVCALFYLFCSCSETFEPEADLVGFDYFPLEIGDFKTYQVNQITFTLLEDPDTSDFQLKESVVDTFSTGDQLHFVLHRSTRMSPSDKWSLDSVWTSRRTENHAIVVENNIPLVKMVFPVRLNRVWDGNIFNSLPPDDYEITEIGAVYQTPAGSFSNVLTIFENNDPDTLIYQDIRQVVYAKEIGLIYKRLSILDFCNTDPECLGILESGTKFEQVLIEYGKE